MYSSLVFSLEQSKLTSEVLFFFSFVLLLYLVLALWVALPSQETWLHVRESAPRHLIHLHPPPPAISTLFPLERKKFSLSNKESEVRNCTRGCCWQTLKVYSCRGTSRILGKMCLFLFIVGNNICSHAYTWSILPLLQ